MITPDRKFIFNVHMTKAAYTFDGVVKSAAVCEDCSVSLTWVCAGLNCTSIEHSHLNLLWFQKEATCKDGTLTSSLNGL